MRGKVGGKKLGRKDGGKVWKQSAGGGEVGGKVGEKKLSHTFNTASASLMAPTDLFGVSLCHTRGQLWAKYLRSLRRFSGRKWPFLEK